MPLAPRLPHERLARRALGSLQYGHPTWALLPRLLLGTDGSAVRRRRHESALDCRSRRSCGNRKTFAEGRGGRASAWRPYDWRERREIDLGFTILRLLRKDFRYWRDSDLPLRPL